MKHKPPMRPPPLPVMSTVVPTATPTKVGVQSLCGASFAPTVSPKSGKNLKTDKKTRFFVTFVTKMTA